MKKFRLNLIVAKMDGDSKIERLLKDAGRELSLSSTSAIEVMSENRLFEVLGMTYYDEVDLQEMMHQTRSIIDGRHESM